MKLIISRPHLKLFFWLPTAILKWNWLWSKIISSTDSIKQEELKLILPYILKGLRSYIKKNGHFNLIEVKSQDKTKIKIKV